ncbi:unnamed protein product [Parajaminaea phylloscopi]
MFTPTAPLATRILALSGFPPELKTRDIQAVFSQWENDRGGFKIKWVNDTNALVIFQDPSTAKRAYLHTLMSPAPVLTSADGVPAKVRPYSADDADDIIASVLNRPRSRSNATHDGEAVTSSPKRSAHSSASRPSAASPPAGLGHRRHPSGSNPSLPAKPVAAALFDAAQGGPSPARHLANAAAAERARAANESGASKTVDGNAHAQTTA